MAQFTSESLLAGPPGGQLGYNLTTLGIIDAGSGQLLKSYYPMHQVQETGSYWTGFKRTELKMHFVTDQKVFIVYSWDTPTKSLALISFDPMQQDSVPMPTSVRLIAYEASNTPPMTLNAVNLLSLSSSLSDDRKFMYIGGGTEGRASLFKWSISAKTHSWHFLMHDIINPIYRRDFFQIVQIAQSLNKTNDTNHIAFCARTEKTTEIKRNLFGYLRENKYSQGGIVHLNLTVYLDAETKGMC
jgi:hypothetical protein